MELELELVFELVEDMELMVVVRIELVVEERDVDVVLLRALPGEEEIPMAELRVILLLELVLGLEMVVLEEDSNEEIVAEVLLDLLDTTVGSEYIDDTGVLSWPGPMILVGFEATGDTVLELEVNTGCGVLVLNLLLPGLGDAQRPTALEIVLLTG